MGVRCDRWREGTLPRIFDIIGQALVPELQQILGLSKRAGFCVGCFNLRGWKELDSFIDRWPGGDGLDNQAAVRLKTRLAEEFRKQLAFGAPSNADEAGLRRLAAQLKAKKVVVRMFLRHTLHAKIFFCLWT